MVKYILYITIKNSTQWEAVQKKLFSFKIYWRDTGKNPKPYETYSKGIGIIYRDGRYYCMYFRNKFKIVISNKTYEGIKQISFTKFMKTNMTKLLFELLL